MFRSVIHRCLAPLFKKLHFRLYQLHFNEYYWAIPDVAQLPSSIWTRRTQMPGVRLNEAEQLRLLEEFRNAYASEYATIDRSFGEIDAQVLHCMVRRFKPRRMIEIGSGHSTRIAAGALIANGQACDFTAIEPYPRAFLRTGFPGLTRLVEKKVQDVPVEFFEQLEANDILFIDSSHVLAIGSDVQYEFLEIIPRLRPGVVVHVHDILLPSEHHRWWVDEGRFWSEQYLLQAFLAFNDSFEVLWAAQHLHLEHAESLKRAFATYDPDKCSPSSFWFRRGIKPAS